MNKNIPLIPARYYLRMIELLNQREIPLHEILLESELDLEQLLKLDNTALSMQQIEKFIEICLKYPQNSDLAFELGSLLKLSSHSLVGYAMLTSQTPRHALQLVTQYFRLIIPSFRLKLQEDAQSCTLIFEPTMKMSRLTLNFHIEAIAVAFYHNISELLGVDIPYYHTYLSIMEPRHIKKYEKMPKATFHFGALTTPSIQLVLPSDILNVQLPMADAFSLKIVEQRCQELIREISNSGEVEAWIRMMLRETYHLPTLNDCAKLLNISTKTLQRYLKKQNSDFHVIRMEVIIERAQSLLTETDKTITDIADELGYSTSANFARTFKAQVGCSPLEYRQNMKA